MYTIQNKYQIEKQKIEKVPPYHSLQTYNLKQLIFYFKIAIHWDVFTILLYNPEGWASYLFQTLNFIYVTNVIF